MKRLLLFYCLFIFAIDLNGANKKESSLIEIGKEFTDARIGQSLFYFKD